jgi:hypothetical protein
MNESVQHRTPSTPRVRQQRLRSEARLLVGNISWPGQGTGDVNLYPVHPVGLVQVETSTPTTISAWSNGGIILEDNVSLPKNNIPEPIDPLE